MKYLKLYIISLSIIFTYFIYTSARASAVAERGNNTAFGGEMLLLLIPFVVWIIYDNITLTIQVNREQKQKRTHSNIQITEIKEITEVK